MYLWSKRIGTIAATQHKIMFKNVSLCYLSKALLRQKKDVKSCFVGPYEKELETGVSKSALLD